MLRLLFLPQRSPQPQDYKVSEKKNENLSFMLFLLIIISVLFPLILYLIFVSISTMTRCIEGI